MPSLSSPALNTLRQRLVLTKPCIYQPTRQFSAFTRTYTTTPVKNGASLLADDPTNPVRARTVGAIIVGDEVLAGKTLDTNSHHLARVCFDTGFELKRSVVIPDHVDEIAELVKLYSGKYDLVFTSGGIGPTHDDMTYEGVAKGLNDELVMHKPTIERMKSIAGFDLTKQPARARMALLPSRSEVVFTPGLWVPLAIVDNVHILPGVPSLFQRMLAHYAQTTLLSLGCRFYRMLVRTELPESEIASTLEKLQSRHREHGIKIGSYPNWDQVTGRQVLVSVVGRNDEKVREVWEEVLSNIVGSERVVDHRALGRIFPEIAEGTKGDPPRPGR